MSGERFASVKRLIGSLSLVVIRSPFDQNGRRLATLTATMTTRAVTSICLMSTVRFLAAVPRWGSVPAYRANARSRRGGCIVCQELSPVKRPSDNSWHPFQSSNTFSSRGFPNRCATMHIPRGRFGAFNIAGQLNEREYILAVSAAILKT